VDYWVLSIGKGPEVKETFALTTVEFIRLRRELKVDLEDELTRAEKTEKLGLRARIAELESQIATPDKSLAEAQKRITDLEALLDRSGNDIGGDRIKEAKAALEQGD
jgi:chromosome segregation ATPase